MKDDDAIPTTTAFSKKESADSGLFSKGRYKFWALAAILLLAFWSMFTGTVSLRWSGTLNGLSNDLDTPIHDDLDVLEMEEREKVVKHMWDVYTNSRRIRLPRFWQEAFEAAYEELISDVPAVRNAAVTEIAKMSVRSIDFDPPPIQSTMLQHTIVGRSGYDTYLHNSMILSTLGQSPHGFVFGLPPKGLILMEIRAREFSKSLKQDEKDREAATSTRA